MDLNFRSDALPHTVDQGTRERAIQGRIFQCVQHAAIWRAGWWRDRQELREDTLGRRRAEHSARLEDFLLGLFRASWGTRAAAVALRQIATPVFKDRHFGDNQNQGLMLFDYYLARWGLTPDGQPIVTRGSRLLPVCHGEMPAMLKIAVEAEERRGTSLMVWWNGEGAVRVLAHEGNALLME